jgi:hypothetical protein
VRPKLKPPIAKSVEIYLSTDIEADGPIPGMHSMLSLASVALSAEGEVLGEFSINLETLEGAQMHPKMADWWQTQPQAWAACRTDLQSPELAMASYLAWIRTFQGRAVFVAMPASFDFLFVYWYFIRFCGECPFGHSALDMKSFAMAQLGCEFRKAGKSGFPMAWRSLLPHTHIALDDAREQGESFIAMLRASRARHAEVESSGEKSDLSETILRQR